MTINGHFVTVFQEQNVEDGWTAAGI